MCEITEQAIMSLVNVSISNRNEKLYMTNNIQEVDSLVANEFAVEIGGEVASGIFSVRGLTLYQVDENGKRIKPPFEITKMVQRDSDNTFNQWHRETMDSRDSDKNPTRKIAIVAIDDGVETRRWTVEDAYIASIRYTDYDTASFEMIEETYLIMYSDIKESWTYADNET